MLLDTHKHLRSRKPDNTSLCVLEHLCSLEKATNKQVTRRWGRGHTGQGRGYTDQGRGHTDQGRGHTDQGRATLTKGGATLTTFITADRSQFVLDFL